MSVLNKYSLFLKELVLILYSQIGSVLTSLKIIKNESFNKISFHPKAGKIIDGIQYLFDGSPTVYPHGSDRVHNIYRLTRGAPEPEEILLFLKIIKRLKNNSTMIEIGAGQGFYSILASKYLTNGKLILVEANPNFINILKKNINLNNFQSRSIIIQCAITNNTGRMIKFKESSYASAIGISGEYKVQAQTIDSLYQNNKLKTVDVLHMDIQGEEFNALSGMKRTLSQKKVNFIIIGTHSINLHQECENYLRKNDYSILYSKDQTKCSSYDGILIASSKVHKKSFLDEIYD